MIRFEVQCKYPKLYPLAKDIRHESKYNIRLKSYYYDDQDSESNTTILGPSIPIDVVMTSKNSEMINQKCFFKVIRKGDYFTLEIAREIVKSYHYRKDKEERILYALELVKEHHGIAKAKSKLYGPDLDDFKRSPKDLDNILVNPVTIPRRWGIKHIPHLLRAYNEANYEDEMIPEQEYIEEST